MDNCTRSPNESKDIIMSLSHTVVNIRLAFYHFIYARIPGSATGLGKRGWKSVQLIKTGGLDSQLAKYEPAKCSGGQDDQQQPGLYQE